MKQTICKQTTIATKNSGYCCNNINRKSNYFTITFAVRITLLLSFTTTT
jgi:hypothetical protein